MIIELVSSKLGLENEVVKNIQELVASGATIPFIARYRKEMTGSLDETKIREVVQELERANTLMTRKERILNSLEERGLLTEDLKRLVASSKTLAELEAVYSPYKTTKKTLAQQAREKGIDELVNIILKSPSKTKALIQSFAEMKKLPEEELEEGIVHIFAETMANDYDARQRTLSVSKIKGSIANKIISPEKRKAKKGYEGQENKESKLCNEDVIVPLRKILPHQIQAFQKAENRGQIRIVWDLPETEIHGFLVNVIQSKVGRMDHKLSDLVSQSAVSSFKRLVKPSITRQIYRELIEVAEQHAIKVFTSNLRKLLMQPPLKGKKIMGLDPGLRTGTKAAIIDEKGDVLWTGTFDTLRSTYAYEKIHEKVNEYGVEFIALGNGTGSRDVEEIIKKVISNASCDYSIVSEAGASVYSASEIAQEEFPELDVSIRGAISIARRLQDPLAELVKVDPRSLGVGQYQHDIDQKKLKKALEDTLEEVVNLVGVDVNTASWPLLSYVAGLSKSTAKNIIEFRKENGSIKSRNMVQKIKGIGSKTFEQCAGFLRIFNGENPLDSTPIHPESYNIAQQILDRLQLSLSDLTTDRFHNTQVKKFFSKSELVELASSLNVGIPTLLDILDALQNPLKDPRGEFRKITFDPKVKSIEDLEPGMVLNGEVRNVTDFGAFIDIGVKRDALVHISQLADKFVKHPSDIVSVGDRVRVRILKVDDGRISGSLKGMDQLQKEN